MQVEEEFAVSKRAFRVVQLFSFITTLSQWVRMGEKQADPSNLQVFCTFQKVHYHCHLAVT